MKHFLVAAGVAAMMAAACPALAATDAECTDMWTKADANKDGKLTEAEGSRFFAAMRVSAKPVADGAINQAAFMENCKAGLFTAAKQEAGAPLSGSNSFTEAQARDRAVATGLANVSALTKDANGVWRGTASSGTKNVNIAVDFKGNVVAQ